MDKKDSIVLDLYTQVKGYVEPEDHPASSSEIAIDVNLALEEVLVLCKELSEEGLMKISFLNSPPLIYLTLTGVARARRLVAAFSGMDPQKA